MATIGLLRERIAIQRRVETGDSHGARSSVVYQTLDTVGAELLPVQTYRAGEQIAAQAVQAERTTRFRIRTRSDVRPTMRVSWRPSWTDDATPKTLEVHGVEPFGDGRVWMVLNCGEVVAA